MGYATTMMKKTGRAMRLDTNHRRSKIVTLSKGTSASALTGKVYAKLQDQEAKFLDTSDVVRDVENLPGCLKQSKYKIAKLYISYVIVIELLDRVA